MTIATENATRFATTRDAYIAQRENEIVNTAADRLAEIVAAYRRTGLILAPHFIVTIAHAYAELEQMGPLEPVEVRIERSSK